MKPSIIIVWSIVLLSACGGTIKPPTPGPEPTPAPIVINDPTFPKQCDDIWKELLGRAIDPAGLESCLAQFRGGASGGDVRASVLASVEYRERLQRIEEERRSAEEAAKFQGTVTADGRSFVAGGKPFIWKGITQFGLAHKIAIGQEADAINLIDALRVKTVNVSRVLTTAKLLFDLSPEDGRAAMRKLFPLALARGMTIQAVAIADSAERGPTSVDFWFEHADRVAADCEAAPNCWFELFNEYDHRTQLSVFHDAAVVDGMLARILERHPGLRQRSSAGSPQNHDEALTPGGAAVMRHLVRDASKEVRHQRDLASVSETLGKPVVSSEPVGCAAPGTPGQRYYEPSHAFELALVARGFGLGMNLHLETGLRSDWLTETEWKCVDQFIAGMDAIPASVPLPRFQNTNSTELRPNRRDWPESPIVRADLEDKNASDETEDRCAQRVFSFLWGNQGISVVVGATCDPRIVWGNGWVATPQVSPAPTMRLFAIARPPSRPFVSSLFRVER